jgi:hypothetical protein
LFQDTCFVALMAVNNDTVLINELEHWYMMRVVAEIIVQDLIISPHDNIINLVCLYEFLFPERSLRFKSGALIDAVSAFDFEAYTV